MSIFGDLPPATSCRALSVDHRQQVIAQSIMNAIGQGKRVVAVDGPLSGEQKSALLEKGFVLEEETFSDGMVSWTHISWG